MKYHFNKFFTAIAFAGAMLGATQVAKADVLPAYPVFTVNEGAVTGDTRLVNANKISGIYDEYLKQNINGTFDVTLLWQAQSFSFVDIASTSTAKGSDLGGGRYHLYALYKASGIVTQNGFEFVPSANDGFELYGHKNVDNEIFSFAPTLTNGQIDVTKFFTVTSSLPDIKLANGEPVTGSGSIACAGSNNCGSFGATSSLDLTTAGKAYFTVPNPFYNMVIQTGNFNSFVPSNAAIHITGEANAIFAVPEPTAIALLGIGMLGIALSRRKNLKQS